MVILALIILWACQSMDEYEGDYFTDYQACRDNGFTKEYCLQRPNPNQCLCDNGQTGTYVAGYGSECVCPGSSTTEQTEQTEEKTNEPKGPMGWYLSWN